MAVVDRIGFALTFLSDTKLAEFIKGLTDELTHRGDLAGVMLTGNIIP